MVDLASKMLVHEKLRFAITVAGVAFAVALVLVQVGLFVGLLDNASVTIDHTDADLWVTSRSTPNVDFGHAFSERRVNRVRAVPGVARADNLIVAFMTIALPSGAEESTLVYALSDFHEWGLPWDVHEGELADLKRGSYFMIDESAARRFGDFTVGEKREIFGKRLGIVGRTKDAKSFTTTPISFVDFGVAQSLSPMLRESTTYILVKLTPDADAEAVRRELRSRLPHNDVYTKAEWAARSRNYWLDNTGIGFSMVLTVFLGCLVGVVVVAQTLYASTMEHLREFGTVKAIGGSNWDIYAIVAKQAGMSAVLGFVLGALPSYASATAHREDRAPSRAVGAVRRAGVRRDHRPVSARGDGLVPKDRVHRSQPRLPHLREAMPTLLATDITKSFDEGPRSVDVLRGVSLTVHAGEVVGVEGPSGSGKTTLLSILGCILTPTSGTVVVDGRAAPNDRPSALPAIRRRSIGFVFQQFNLFPSLTAVENVEYALNIKGVKGRAARREAEEAIELVGLADRAHFHPRDLSGGQKQRVAIARALAASPAVLLADEPTANLDTQTGAQILALFRDLARQRGCALLIVTHDPKVRAITDRVVTMRDGLIDAGGVQ